MNLWQEQLYIDIVVKRAIDSIANPVLDTLMIYITNIGAPLTFYIMASAGFLYLTYKHKIIDGFFMVFCLFVSWGGMNLFKAFFMRERPIGEHLAYAEGYSFPSGHATLSMAFYGFIIYLLLAESKKSRKKKNLAGFLVVLIFLIGLSRIYLNVHYATDVLAGYILGIIFLVFFIFALRTCKARIH
ncbi:MAG TPA: phosphatase PAP2 family protein [Syntrophomonadaceae bacterium]|nr:phosphatase PAP2 family protein [Syntrophomonadaceae bacterium]HPR93225.1 phosphatase PAP2 family protein [Syntrophomonadaceae bacterium]